MFTINPRIKAGVTVSKLDQDIALRLKDADLTNTDIMSQIKDQNQGISESLFTNKRVLESILQPKDWMTKRTNAEDEAGVNAENLAVQYMASLKGRGFTRGQIKTKVNDFYVRAYEQEMDNVEALYPMAGSIKAETHIKAVTRDPVKEFGGNASKATSSGGASIVA
jgi:hypothetical protein